MRHVRSPLPFTHSSDFPCPALAAFYCPPSPKLTTRAMLELGFRPSNVPLETLELGFHPTNAPLETIDLGFRPSTCSIRDDGIRVSSIHCWVRDDETKVSFIYHGTRDDELGFQLGFHPVQVLGLGAHKWSKLSCGRLLQIQGNCIEFECVVVVGFIKTLWRWWSSKPQWRCASESVVDSACLRCF